MARISASSPARNSPRDENAPSAPTVEELRSAARTAFEQALDIVERWGGSAEEVSLRDFERALREMVFAVGRALVVLFLAVVPTATEQELGRRRGNRAAPAPTGSPRHRGRAKRRRHPSPPRRSKGDKAKNGKVATMVVMYTLRRSGVRARAGSRARSIDGTTLRLDPSATPSPSPSARRTSGALRPIAADKCKS